MSVNSCNRLMHQSVVNLSIDKLAQHDRASTIIMNVITDNDDDRGGNDDEKWMPNVLEIVVVIL